MKVTMQLDGLQELEAALKELPKATGKNTIRRAITAAAQPMAQEATQLIKVRKQVPQVVVSAIQFSSGAAGKAAFADALSRGLSRAEAGEAAHAANAAAAGEDNSNITSGVASVGPTKRAFYGFEYGTRRLPPKPFMRPAWDDNKVAAAEAIRDELKTQIEKARVRIVMKQLRLLAAMNAK